MPRNALRSSSAMAFAPRAETAWSVCNRSAALSSGSARSAASPAYGGGRRQDGHWTSDALTTSAPFATSGTRAQAQDAPCCSWASATSPAFASSQATNKSAVHAYRGNIHGHDADLRCPPVEDVGRGGCDVMKHHTCVPETKRGAASLGTCPTRLCSAASTSAGVRHVRPPARRAPGAPCSTRQRCSNAAICVLVTSAKKADSTCGGSSMHRLRACPWKGCGRRGGAPVHTTSTSRGSARRTPPSTGARPPARSACLAKQWGTPHAATTLCRW